MMFGLNFPDCRLMVPQILAVIKALPVRPTLGLVCDPGQPPESYLAAFQALSANADLLCRPFDSSGQMKPNGHQRYSVMTYRRRAQEYCLVLGPYCRLFECGNEITLPSAFVGADIAEQTQAAIGVATRAGIKTVVTYFWDADEPNLMGTLASEWNLASDVAGVSVYPRSYESWNGLDEPFEALESCLPGIPKAIMEFGGENSSGKDGDTPAQHKALVTDFLKYLPRNPKVKYLGGGFEWDGGYYLLEAGELTLYQRLWRQN